MPYTARRQAHSAMPMSEMNITPLIDVMLVLLIMFIIVIPMAVHTLAIPLPTSEGRFETQAVNTVHIDARDQLYWNGQSLDRQELLNQLASAATMPSRPLIRFEPDALASYERSASTIALIKDSGVETFAFVGNEKYRAFRVD
ncbi:ExbD/TolR family protein [Qipengyuania zhejiangensis]|uniref:ExbD/TolR family protein n=1 Tax=Qipengyuania zhejiangensis TaxID=3077782 RepID=UPI002D794A0E|nr:biopolymer transporter ExbD [Qipengyuania sp. Z2]